ncbi:LOW QUALITY PROTEIN: microcephalin-like [Trematomus bernacchii]|uniref:LOW QUALITY PROTEIN: microcephalin-like n=1 Tax=Trematomus bernacchii TaxID=40690 RepID=UPI00146E108C|nr:LOW QUALITY PROTEIN: microcephalin-like [Trematomus bernacchii]
MTTGNDSSVLKDVVAYVDVWSSDKTANYSKPFVQQLQEMGAQVPKTLNKQVTHVVFNNGHPATWRNAKKSDVRLVSVLWVGRCYDDGVRADETLYPAFNDESNPVLKNKRHRCMQPKDSPERTPENDTRMKKKLDKLMKNIAPRQPLEIDCSPIIIDHENGIVYSPALKRSDYMAQRLKDMKEKRENISPTASQTVESCPPSELKPSLGSTPTVFKFTCDLSDDEPAYSPDKEEGRTRIEVTDHDHLEQRQRHHVLKRIISPVKCPDFEDKKGTSQKKPTEKYKPGVKSADSKNSHKETRPSEIKPPSPSPNKSEKGKQNVKSSKSFTETKTPLCSDAPISSSSLSAPTKSDNAALELSKETLTSLQKIPKRTRPSFSSLVRSFSPFSESKNVASASTDRDDDDVFEDYFSSANHHQRSQSRALPNLPVKRDIQLPFELDSVPNKRKQRRSVGLGSEMNSKKKMKLEKSLPSVASSKPQSPPQQDVKESLPALEGPSCDVKLLAKKRRQSTLPFTSSNTTTRDAGKQRRAALFVQPTTSTDAHTIPALQKDSEVNALPHTLENAGRGNERTVAAVLTKIPPEDKEETHNEQVSLSVQNMVNNTKAMRTLVMTSMSTEKQQTLAQVVSTLGGFSIVDRVSESTTHVVSGGHRRTLNILLGIARGCWILSFEWILWCLEQRQWIPEEPYELSEQFPAAQICRLQRHLSAGEHQQDLFQDQPAMFVSQHSQPPTQSLEELIELCGGTVCKTVRQAGICIGKYSGRKPEGSRVLSEQWVLDSIMHLKRLSYDNYDLE